MIGARRHERLTVTKTYEQARRHHLGVGALVGALVAVGVAAAILAGTSSNSSSPGALTKKCQGQIVRGYCVAPGSNLTGANLKGANLRGANFKGTTLVRTNLTFADLTGAQSGTIAGVPSGLPAQWALRKGYLIGPGANLTGANLGGANLSGLNLAGANLNGANLSNANLDQTNLSQATVVGANLDTTILATAKVAGLSSGSLSGVPASLPDQWKVVGGYLVGPQANLKGASLASANLAGVNLADADLTWADLTSVRSGKITGSPSGLPGHWKLVGGFLVGPSADLSQEMFTNIDVTGAEFAKVNMDKIRSSNLTGSPASIPQGWAFTNGYLVGPTADLRGAQLQRAELANVDLSNVNATSAKLSYATMTNANLTDGNFSKANLSSVFLKGATVNKGTDFSGAFLKGTHDLDPGATYSTATTCSNGDRYGSGGDCP
jgi:uncharacterized protein YjbI with pentapeptide repeats